MKYFSFNSSTKKWQPTDLPTFVGNINAPTVNATTVNAVTVNATTLNALTIAGVTATFTGTATANALVSTTVTATTVTATTGAITTLNINGTGSSQVNISSSNAYGGAGYAGFLTLSNTTAGATNLNKHIRTSLDGTLEVVNNAYDSIIFQLSDSGTLTVPKTGVDGGITLRPWTAPGGSGYNSLATANMVGSEYALLTDGTYTYISGGVGGSTRLRGGENSSVAEVEVTPTAVNITANVTPTKQIPYAISAGKVTANVSAANQATATVTFPASRFTFPPVVTFSVSRITASSSEVYALREQAIASTGVTLVFVTRSAGAITETVEFNWIAIQMSSSAYSSGTAQ
jgi:hypothetical protein